MDPPPSRSRGGFDKYDFYHWLGCKILALGESTEVELLLAVQVGDVRRVKELVSGMEEKDRTKLAEMHFDGSGLLHLAVNLGKIEAVRYFVEELGFDVECAAINGGAGARWAKGNGDIFSLKSY
ncbi:hypothetical protein PR202_ga12999 [Eleusine coracana subsp. coracana]|uniref:Uncharacterized protein n=1 Tax=Eleusine coracana subsp. coracana TaxID=191504 RepID=A0AAV5CDL3_ELECO|nr:hypothetical protein PR202_ga12999 [Eleusine coracana subsp. coracana]